MREAFHQWLRAQSDWQYNRQQWWIDSGWLDPDIVAAARAWEKEWGEKFG